MLETPVGDLMAKDPILVDADATVVAAVNIMNEKRTGCVLVQQAGKPSASSPSRSAAQGHLPRRQPRLEGRCGHDRNPETLPPSASVHMHSTRWPSTAIGISDRRQGRQADRRPLGQGHRSFRRR